MFSTNFLRSLFFTTRRNILQFAFCKYSERHLTSLSCGCYLLIKTKLWIIGILRMFSTQLFMLLQIIISKHSSTLSLLFILVDTFLSALFVPDIFPLLDVSDLHLFSVFNLSLLSFFHYNRSIKISLFDLPKVSYFNLCFVLFIPFKFILSYLQHPVYFY